MDKPQIARLLKTRLTQLKMNQKEAAASLGVDPSTLSRWASGAIFPEPSNHQAIADFLSLSLEEVETAVDAASKPPEHEFLDDMLRIYRDAAALRDRIARSPEAITDFEAGVAVHTVRELEDILSEMKEIWLSLGGDEAALPEQGKPVADHS